MKVVPLPPEGLRVGRQMPFALRDGSGKVLVARGMAIENDKQLQMLLERQLFIELGESQAFQRAYGGQLDRMVRSEVSLGKIAQAVPDYDAIATAVAPPPPSAALPGLARAGASAPAASAAASVLLPDTEAPAPAVLHRAPLASGPADWPNLQMRLKLLLVEPRAEGWIERLRLLRDEAVAAAQRQPDRTLLRLVYDAGQDFRDYSANHALFVAVLCALAAPHCPGWDPAWHDPLTLAALSMNLSITGLQDELARQPGRLTDAQRKVLHVHGERSAQMLRDLGVSDPLWLEAVAQHHHARPGPLAGRAPGDLLARVLRRADRYAARLSPRRSRPASNATQGVQAVFLDEGGHPDDAGQLLVKFTGMYPPGSWVKLACGEVALVLKRTAFLKAPVLASMINREGLPMAVPALRNARLPDYTITAALPPGQIMVRPQLDQMEKMA